MKTYEAVAVREGRWWTVEIKGLPPHHVGVTQGRTWKEAEEMARDAIALLLDVPEDSFDVRLVPGDEAARSALEALDDARHAAQQAAQALERAQRDAATALTSHGFTVRDAGAALGISYQRVSQLAPKPAA